MTATLDDDSRLSTRETTTQRRRHSMMIDARAAITTSNRRRPLGWDPLSPRARRDRPGAKLVRTESLDFSQGGSGG